MRLTTAFLLVALAVAIVAKRKDGLPKLLNIQINRCSSPAIFNNTNEEEKVDLASFIVRSEFNDYVIFYANESGTMEFFVVGHGDFTVKIVNIDGLMEFSNVQQDVDSRQGGALITVPFKIVRDFLEIEIDVIFNTPFAKKVTTVTASTMHMKPRHETIPGIFGQIDDGLANAYTESPVAMECHKADINWNNQRLAMNHTDLRLHFITMNRLSEGVIDHIYSPGNNSNTYAFKIKRGEKGQMLFHVSGSGNKRVSMQSYVETNLPAKVMPVIGKFAAFGYSAAGVEYAPRDDILVTLMNDCGEELLFYVYITRVD